MADREIARFRAQYDDGRVVTVIGRQKQIPWHPLANPSGKLAGPTHFTLADGRDVSPVQGDPKAFQIFDTDEIIRKID